MNNSPFWILTSDNGKLHKESMNGECPWCRTWLFTYLRERWNKNLCDIHCYKCGTKYYVDRRT